MSDRLPVGVSACLLGQAVRYDGGHKAHAGVLQILSQHFDLQSFCPEVDIGLGVPRAPIRLIQHNGQIACVDVQDSRLDYTQRLRQGAAAQHAWVATLCGYIFKRGSPSCGLAGVPVYHDGVPIGTDQGLFAAWLTTQFPTLPVVEESQLDDAATRDHFIRQVKYFKQQRDHQNARRASPLMIWTPTA